MTTHTTNQPCPTCGAVNDDCICHTGAFREFSTVLCRARVPTIGTSRRGLCLELADYRRSDGTPVCDAHYRRRRRQVPPHTRGQATGRP